MAVTKSLPADADILAMGPELGATCGDNAMNWARAFCAVAANEGIALGDDPEGWMVGWFANAIECASDARNGTGPVVLPDGSAVFVGSV
jgi:hypothetical protein